VALYSRLILPRLIDLVMRNKEAAGHRARILPAAMGSVLEVGIGSGLNLPFYTSQVKQLFGVDPSGALLNMARPKAERVPFPVELIQKSAEELPFRDAAVDTVVVTWALCSIADPARALGEMRRVLRPQGQLIFVEHGLSPDPTVRAWQDRINPLWRRVAGGCNLNRKIDDLVRSAGFQISELRTEYLSGPRPMTYTYEGSAR
jgi:ubiquinone/menaquinone biosynthesis C-methylase UbiE